MPRKKRCRTVDWDWDQFVHDAKIEAMTDEELGRWVRLLGAMYLSEHPGRMLKKAVERQFPNLGELASLLDVDGDWYVHRRTERDYKVQTERIKAYETWGRIGARRRWLDGPPKGDASGTANASYTPSLLTPKVKTSCPEPQEPEAHGPYSLTDTRGKIWNPKDILLTEMRKAYPGVDLEREFAEMRVWLVANPAKGKTYRGLPRFANNWLAREQDKPRKNGVVAHIGPPRKPWADEA